MSARYLSELSRRCVGWFVVDDRRKMIYYGVGDALGDPTLNASIQSSAEGRGMMTPTSVMLIDNAKAMLLVLKGETEFSYWLNNFARTTDYMPFGYGFKPNYYW